MVTDERPPVVVMFEGEPFLRSVMGQLEDGTIVYRQEKAYRADAMVVDEVVTA
jgi:hypothetical protein